MSGLSERGYFPAPLKQTFYGRTVSLNVMWAQKGRSFLCLLSISSLAHSCLCLSSLPRQAKPRLYTSLHWEHLRVQGRAVTSVIYCANSRGWSRQPSSCLCLQLGKLLIPSSLMPTKLVHSLIPRCRGQNSAEVGVGIKKRLWLWWQRDVSSLASLKPLPLLALCFSLW